MDKTINGVDYQHHKDYCLVRERDQKKHYPYKKETLLIRDDKNMNESMILLVVNNEFVDPWNSYLDFQFAGRSISTEGMSLDGGFISLIKRVIVQDRHGKEIDRCENLHMLNQILLRALFTDNFVTRSKLKIDETIGTEFFEKLLVDPGEAEDLIGVPGDYTPTFIKAHIPLPFLLGVFRTSQLLPPHLLDGCKLWIQWNTVDEAFTQHLSNAKPYIYVAGTDETKDGNIPVPQTTPVTTLINEYLPFYEIKNIELVTDSILLGHEIKQAIDNEYGTGFPLKIISWELDSSTTTNTPCADAASFSIPIVKPYSKATRAIALHRNIHTNQTELEEDVKWWTYGGTMLTSLVFSQRWKDGSIDYLHKNGRTFPLQPTDDVTHSYYYWMQAFNKNKCYLDTFSDLLRDTWFSGLNLGPSFCKMLARNCTFDKNLPGESKSSLSGVRVDGTSPVDWFFKMPELDSFDVGPPASVSSDTPQSTMMLNPNNYRRRVDLFVEYIKYIQVKGGGNNVFV